MRIIEKEHTNPNSFLVLNIVMLLLFSVLASNLLEETCKQIVRYHVNLLNKICTHYR